jgi:hypothetical protein
MENTLNFTAIKNSFVEWKQKIGLTDADNPGCDIKYLINELDKYIKEMSIEDIEFYITRIASYNLFLQTEKSKILSRLLLFKEQYKRLLYTETEKLTDTNHDFKFKKIEEKETIVLLNNEQIRKLKNLIIENEIKFEQIKELPHAIENKLRTLEYIYKQKQRSMYVKT